MHSSVRKTSRTTWHIAGRPSLTDDWQVMSGGWLSFERAMWWLTHSRDKWPALRHWYIDRDDSEHNVDVYFDVIDDDELIAMTFHRACTIAKTW